MSDANAGSVASAVARPRELRVGSSSRLECSPISTWRKAELAMERPGEGRQRVAEVPRDVVNRLRPLSDEEVSRSIELLVPEILVDSQVRYGLEIAAKLEFAARSAFSYHFLETQELVGVGLEYVIGVLDGSTHHAIVDGVDAGRTILGVAIEYVLNR